MRKNTLLKVVYKKEGVVAAKGLYKNDWPNLMMTLSIKKNYGFQLGQDAPAQDGTPLCVRNQWDSVDIFEVESETLKVLHTLRENMSEF